VDDLRRDGPVTGRAVGFEAAKAERQRLLAMDDGVTLRPYRPADRPAVERICALTGLRGELDELFCDRPLFVKLWLSPYLDGEPEHCIVAEQGGKVVGYLVGNVRPGFEARAVRILFPRLLTLAFRWMTGRYRSHPPSGRFVRWLLTRAWRELPKTPPHSANFHFNIDPDLMVTVIGERMIAKFEEHLEAAGVPGWHAILFSSKKKRPVSLYRRMGFQIVDRVPNTLFTGGVETVCIYKPLDIWINMARVPMRGKAGLRSDAADSDEDEE
jgi:GNAT superfamily N-acetyltransferase